MVAPDLVMLRFLFRTLGLILLACAFAAAIVDGTRSIAAGSLVFTTLGQAMELYMPTQLASLQDAAARVHHWLRDPGLVMILLLPLWLIAGALGGGLLALTQPRRPVIGFSSRA